MAQGRQEGGLAEAHAAARLQSVAPQEVGGGAYLLLVALSELRRMSKDYERLCATTGEAFVYAAMTRLMVERLTRA